MNILHANCHTNNTVRFTVTEMLRRAALLNGSSKQCSKQGHHRHHHRLISETH